MAVETVAELYYQLGLDTTKLDAGFIDAQKTVNQNMRIMNRQEALIKLKADVAIQGLDENIDLTDALKIRQDELAQRLELTKDRVELTAAAYEQMTQSQGENSEAAQLLAIQLEKERLVMAQLARQTRELNEQQKVAIDVQWEMLGVLEPAWKGLERLYTAGSTLGSLSLGQAQVAAAILTTLGAIVAGTKKANDALEEENLAKEGEPEDYRTVLHLDPRLAPVKVAVLPLMKKDGLAELAKEIQNELKEDFVTDYDQSGAIGKRYRRQDEIGTPFCVTVDYETMQKTLEDGSENPNYNTVTLRFRDSMEQIRIPRSQLSARIHQEIKDYEKRY